MPEGWKASLQGNFTYALRKSTKKTAKDQRREENQELERHYGVSWSGQMSDAVRRKRFGHPESAGFAKNNIVELKTDPFQFPRFNTPLFVHRAIVGKLNAALKEVSNFVHGRPVAVLGESASTKKTDDDKLYKIIRMHGYDFRYGRGPEPRTLIRARDRAGQYPHPKAEDWFNKQINKKTPGFEAFARRTPYRWDNKADISVIAAVYDCRCTETPSGRPRGPQQKFSNHAFGLAIDINPATNGLYSSHLWDMPIEIVQIMVYFGFHWGGFFMPHDPMHFQYEGVPAARPIVANREQARFFFPFNPDNVVESPVKYYFLNECKELGGGSRRPERSSSPPPPRGFYGLGLLQNVHGGIHLQPRTAGPNVRVMTDGYIVAARLITQGTPAGFSTTVRGFVGGQDIGFVVVRHEFAPFKPGDKKKKPEDKKKAGEHQNKPDDKKGPPKDDRFKDADIIYSLYMHLVPPAWGALDADHYTREVPWFQRLYRLRHGGVVDIDPLSPKLGTTYWSDKALSPKDTSFTVQGRGQIEARKDGKRVAVGKPAEPALQVTGARPGGCLPRTTEWV